MAPRFRETSREEQKGEDLAKGMIIEYLTKNRAWDTGVLVAELSKHY